MGRNGVARSGPGVEVVHPGSLLHAARGGTIVLRNIDELPVRVQARLATLFRDREFKTRPNGGAQLLSLRPVAIVEPEFHALVTKAACGRISTAASRNSRSRFPPCASAARTSHRWRSCSWRGRARCSAVETKTMDTAAQTVLAALPWHGNARELKDLLEGLVQATPDPAISLRALLEHITLDAPNGVHPVLGASLREARQRFEREYIAAVVAQHHGRIPDAAKSLGIQRTNLYRKLRALKLSHSEEVIVTQPRA